jgi:hypothetical protein
MSPENRDEYLYDYEPPKKPAKPEKEEIKDKALYAEKLKDYKKDLEIYEKKLKIHTEFHKQLRQLRNQFDDYRIRFMLFDLAPGSNQSINAFFKTADFIFLVLDTTREGENQYKNYLTHMMKSISYLEYDTKSTSNGERIMIPRVHVLFNKADNMQKVQKLKEEMDRCARAKLFNAVRLKLDNKSEVNINDISVERLMEINEDFNKSLYMAYSKNTEQVSNFSFFSRVIFNESKLPDKLSAYPVGSNWNKHTLKTLEHLKDFMLHYRLWTAFKGKKVSDDDNYKSTISKFFEFIREDVLGYTDLKK